MTYRKGHGRIHKESCSYIPRHNCWWFGTIQTCCYKRRCPYARQLDEREEGRRGLGEALTHLVTAWSNMPLIPVWLGLQFIERYINVIDVNTLVQIDVCIFCYIFCIMWQLTPCSVTTCPTPGASCHLWALEFKRSCSLKYHRFSPGD